MTYSRSWGAGLWCAVAALAATACEMRHDDGVVLVGPGQALESTDVLVGPLVELPAALKQSDFRLNPPKVLGMDARPAGQGSLLEVQLAPDDRLKHTLTVAADPTPLVLHDDGQAGDARAGDHIYSLITPIPFTVLKNQERTEIARRKQLQLLTVPIYDGRTLLTEQPVALRDVAGLVTFLPLIPSTNPHRTLMVTDLSVVEDPSRTFNPCQGAVVPGTPMGHWTFGYLMQQMANQTLTGVDPADLVMDWLQTWNAPQTINGSDVGPRHAIDTIIAAWPRTPAHKLDLARAPVRLLAIVNRIDLVGNFSYGAASGAEGRFVFELLDGSCSPQQFLIILEYGVPKSSCIALRDWARRWRELDALTPGGAAYNDKLEALTETFAHANADPTKVAGSAIDQVRTNETALLHNGDGGAQWELREFKLASTTAGARLVESTVKQTPDLRFNGRDSGSRSADLAAWINAYQTSILAERHTVSLTFPLAPGGPFLGASTPNQEMFLPALVLDYWTASGITNNDARHKFSLNTCNGCHGQETGTSFTHIDIKAFGTETRLSGFLTGISVPDPVVPTTTRTFNDLRRRGVLLDQIAGSACAKFGDLVSETAQLLPLPPVWLHPTLATH